MTKELKYRSNNGFTLVELLLVVALMAISFGVTSDILVTLMRSFNKTTVINEIEQQAGSVSLMIEKELKNAAVASNPSGNTSRLQFEDTSGNIANYSFEVVSGVGTLYRYPEGTNMTLVANKRIYAITGNPNLNSGLVGGVNVTCPSGCFVVSPGRPTIVTIDLNFAQAQAVASSSYSGTIRISNTIVVRNTY